MMTRCMTVFALIACLLMAAPIARADDTKKLKTWYERLQRELSDLEKRMKVLDGKLPSSTATTKDQKVVAGLLLQLTNRMMELEKRIAALEKGQTPPQDTNGASPAIAKGGDAKAKDADDGKAAGKGNAAAKGLPAFLNNPNIADKIPAPPKDSKVEVVKTKSGIKKARVGMPKGKIRGPYGQFGCTPSAELFLIQDAPVFGITLVLVNEVGFRFKDEKYVHLIIDGNVSKERMKWKGHTVETDAQIFYVETIHFGTGLPNVLSLIDAGRVRVQIGASEFVLERLCIASLRDLCSCLHPDRVNELR